MIPCVQSMMRPPMSCFALISFDSRHCAVFDVQNVRSVALLFGDGTGQNVVHRVTQATQKALYCF